MSEDYTGAVTPGGDAGRAEPRLPDGHQDRRGPGDGQQLLPAHLRHHRGAGAHRRRRRRPAPARGDRRPRACSPSSPPTSTGTTTGRSRRWSPRPAPPSSPARPTRTRSPSRPAWRSPAGSEHGDRVAVGTCDLRVIALAGHTPGSIALLLDDEEQCGPGRTCSPATRSSPAASATPAATPDAFTRLLDDVETKVFGTLPDETWFYPGHGDDGQLGNERPAPRGVARARLVTTQRRRTTWNSCAAPADGTVARARPRQPLGTRGPGGRARRRPAGWCRSSPCRAAGVGGQRRKANLRTRWVLAQVLPRPQVSPARVSARTTRTMAPTMWSSMTGLEHDRGVHEGTSRRR